MSKVNNTLFWPYRIIVDVGWLRLFLFSSVHRGEWPSSRPAALLLVKASLLPTEQKAEYWSVLHRSLDKTAFCWLKIRKQWLVLVNAVKITFFTEKSLKDCQLFKNYWSAEYEVEHFNIPCSTLLQPFFFIATRDVTLNIQTLSFGLWFQNTKHKHKSSGNWSVSVLRWINGKVPTHVGPLERGVHNPRATLLVHSSLYVQLKIIFC
jgi:hypothetical protein